MPGGAIDIVGDKDTGRETTETETISARQESGTGMVRTVAETVSAGNESSAGVVRAVRDDGDFGGKGEDGKYWAVELEPPSGASPALRSYIAMAEAAIQTVVDLLGRGMPKPPPKVDDLLTNVTRQDLGKGKADKAYQQALAAVEARQTELLRMDNQVIETSIVVAAGQDRTLRSIVNLVEQLENTLKAVDLTNLKAAKKAALEAKLMDLVASIVEAVYNKVTTVADDYAQLTGNSGNENSGKPGSLDGKGTGAGGGTGADVLSSLLPMLAMLPMALLPLIGMLPELLNPEKDDKDAEEGEKGEEKIPPGRPAPTTIDPTAPPTTGATAPEQQPGAPQGRPAPGAPQTGNPGPGDGSPQQAPGSHA